MATTFEDAAIYEYCELLYSELAKNDGGYHPTKHDKQVFEQAALHFGFPISDIEEIYNIHSKLAAEIEMKKINKLPPVLRQKAMKERARNILLNNHDLPFYKKEGPPTEPLPLSIDVLEEEYKDSLEKMAQLGWTIPLTMGLQKFRDVVSLIDDETKLDNYFICYYDQKEFAQMCKHVLNTFQNAGQKKQFEECVEAYKQGLYSVCLTALTTVLEGIISLHGDNPEDVRVMRICHFHADEARKKKQKIKSLSWLSMYEYVKVLYEKSSFGQPEPDGIKRHWIVHGRTSKIGEKADCIRVFNAISTLACIKTFEDKIK